MPADTPNKIINFYAATAQGGKIEVLVSPLSVAPADAITRINKERADVAQKTGSQAVLLQKPVLRACLDMASRRLYLPAQGEIHQGLLAHIQMVVESHYGGLAKAPMINGEPSDLRIFRSSHFPNAWKFIQQALSNKAVDLPVVQANLSKMPDTQQALKMSPQAQGRFVGSNEIDQVQFIMGKHLLHAQATPFILINTSPEAMMTSAHKERIVITGYHTAMQQSNGDVALNEARSEFFHIEFLIYAGWSMGQLCDLLLGRVNAPQDLMDTATYLTLAAKHMATMGYNDITEPPLYYTFQANDNYNQGFWNGPIQQMRFDNGWVLLRSNIVINNDLLRRLGAVPGTIVSAHYEIPTNTMVLSSDPSQLAKNSPMVLSALQSMGANDAIRNSSGLKDYRFSMKVASPNYQSFERRRVSDYPQVMEIVKQALQRIEKQKGIEAKFVDLEVITGPWASIAGMAGGYLSRDAFLKKEIWPGFFLAPPLILIDVKSSPTPADQANVLVHEYWHFIYDQILKGEIVPYESPIAAGSPEERVKRYHRYLQAPDEVLSHIQQIKYMLGLGMSKTEVIQALSGNTTGLNELPVARQYSEFVDEALRQIEQERQDELTE